jgi:hypothetical protein
MINCEGEKGTQVPPSEEDDGAPEKQQIRRETLLKWTSIRCAVALLHRTNPSKHNGAGLGLAR